VPEFRQDPTTGDWVIVAAERADRPGGTQRAEVRQAPAKSDPECPFCAGNEDETPPEILRRPMSDNWVVRVVPNKYPALAPDLSAPLSTDDSLYTRAPARGHYEVIVEGPVHRLETVADQSAVLYECLRAAQQRYRVFEEDPDLHFFSLFKNHGIGAGASLAHPHWQIVASPIIAPSLGRMLEIGAAYWARYGRSVFGDVADREIGLGDRLVEETRRFVVLTPFAPRWSGEVWIIPRGSGVTFGELGGDDLTAFADVLCQTLRRIAQAFDDPALNVLVVSAPLRTVSAPGFRWHVRIQPRMTTQGGFELASGMSITTMAPEVAAETLRAV